MDRVILHCDLNNFYASVETILHPEYKGKPIAVCGDPKSGTVSCWRKVSLQNYGCENRRHRMAGATKMSRYYNRSPDF